MKKLLFFLLAAAVFVGAQSFTNKKASRSAAELVADAKETSIEVDSVLSKILARQDAARRSGNRLGVDSLTAVVKLVREIKGCSVRIASAGSAMGEAQLRGFEAEIAGFDVRLNNLAAPTNPTGKQASPECLQSCNDRFPNRPFRRFLCKLCCLTFCS